jgi:hypothetical protein
MAAAIAPTIRQGVPVTWQDELRQLDEELAAGRLSAEDYRRQRDELLSQSASTAAPAQPTAPHSTPATPATPPVQPQQPSGPFPPPFRWDQSPAESTQYISPIRDGRHAGSDAAESTQVVRGEDAERTQVVPGTAPGFPRQSMPTGPQQAQGGPGGPAGPQAPMWPRTDQSQPPWGQQPLPTTTEPSWLRQGPEAFAASESPGRGKQYALLALAVAVVLVVAGGIYYFVAPEDDPSAGGPTTTVPTSQQPPTSTTVPISTVDQVFANMPRPPGEQDPNSGVISLETAIQLQLLAPEETVILDEAGVTKVAFRGSQKAADEHSPYPDEFGTLAFIATDGDAATEAVNKLKAYQEAAGLSLVPDPLPDLPESIVFEKDVKKDRSVYRGLYASDKFIVRINVVQQPLADEAALSGSYRRATTELIKLFEPNP